MDMKGFILDLIEDRKKGIIGSLLKWILWILSLVYGGIVWGRRKCYQLGFFKTYDIGKVISVGNIVTGGTGKTPLVVAICRYLQKKNKKVTILTRGFMWGRNCREEKESDEVILLKEQLNKVNVLVGSNRVDNAREYLQNNTTDLFVLDDGFQHLKIRRSCNIVLIDALNPFGNKYLIPRGMLRESLGALSNADIFVISRSDLVNEEIIDIEQTLVRYNTKALIVRARHNPIGLWDLNKGEEIPVEFLEGKTVVCFSGIGNPLGFERTLELCGANLQQRHRFEDHCIYKEEDIKNILISVQQEGEIICVTTKKDAVKLDRFITMFVNDNVTVYALDIEMQIITHEEEFYEKLSYLL